MLAGAAIPWVALAAPGATQPERVASRLARLEAHSGVRLGVCALDTGSGKQFFFRAHERFPICSTFKVLLVAAVLARSEHDSGLMQRRIVYSASDLLSYAPVTREHVDTGMSVQALCDAVMRYSDNTAANLLMRRIGGPAGVTAYARSLGDRHFRLDNWEEALNTAPGNVQDTSTPHAMARSLEKVVLGDALPAPQRGKLAMWMRGNTTGDRCIRAALPQGWAAGDKTGAGNYGTRNDIAVLWPPLRPPVVLAIYTTRPYEDAQWRDEVIAAAARIIIEDLQQAAQGAGVPAPLV